MKSKYFILHFVLCASFFSQIAFAQTREDLQKTQQFVNEGYVAAQRQDFLAAIESYTKAINLYPKLAEIFFNRGTIYSFIRDYDLAIKDFDKAIELGKNLGEKQLSEFYMNRGLVFQTKGDYTKAV